MPFYLIIITSITFERKNDIHPSQEILGKGVCHNFSILEGLWIYLSSYIITLKFTLKII